MTLRGVSTLKFVGTVSLGLLTVSYCLSLLELGSRILGGNHGAMTSGAKHNPSYEHVAEEHIIRR